MFGNETRDKLDRILHLQHVILSILVRASNISQEQQAMIDQEVQTALDKIRQTQSLAQSIVAADKLRDKQIADLKAQIAAIPVGTALSAEDKAALQDTANAIDDVNAALTSAIPANTDSAGVSNQGTGVSDGSKPAPLAGTGAPADPVVQMPGVPVTNPASAPAPDASAPAASSPTITPAV